MPVAMKQGFTLVEFLVVIGILGLSVGSILLILTTVVKGVNQTNVQNEVKQNGQNVLDTLSTQIRNAVEVHQLPANLLGQPQALPSSGVSGTTTSSGIWLWAASGEKLTIVCVESSVNTANGSIKIHTAPSSSIDTPNTIDSTFATINNTDLVSGVDIDCNANSFKVVGGSNAKVVAIDFTANQGVQAPSRVDFKASVQFKTAIALRQYQ